MGQVPFPLCIYFRSYGQDIFYSPPPNKIMLSQITQMHRLNIHSKKTISASQTKEDFYYKS